MIHWMNWDKLQRGIAEGTQTVWYSKAHNPVNVSCVNTKCTAVFFLFCFGGVLVPPHRFLPPDASHLSWSPGQRESRVKGVFVLDTSAAPLKHTGHEGASTLSTAMATVMSPVFFHRAGCPPRGAWCGALPRLDSNSPGGSSCCWAPGGM